METATLPRRARRRDGAGAAAPPRRLDADRLARIGFGLLCVACAIGFLVYPTYPNYDSYYSLLWGREVLDLEAPLFEGFRVPTEHPLAIAAGALLSLLGDGGDRVWVGMCFVAFLVLVWGIYRLGRLAFTPVVGAIAAGLVLTRFDFGFLAARGYIDVPYMALVVWAAVLEAERPRRGMPVFALLALAGLLRPEAWLMAALYWCWMAWRASWGDRVRYALAAAAAPVIWAGVDAAVTGDPLFSLHYTSSSAEDLGRQRSLSELPSAVPYFFSNLVKLPVWIAALAGLAIAAVLTPKRMVMPLVLLLSGLGTFVAIGLAGLSVIERYLIVAALALIVFAAVTLGGWSMLERGRLRTAWAGLAVLAALAGTVYTVANVTPRRFTQELTFRGDAHDALEQVLRTPGVAAGLRCGPLTVPNHKLVPDARWILDLPDTRVYARADEDGPGARADRGVALVVTGRLAIFKQALSDANDSPLIQVPPDGFRPVARSRFYAAYARC